MKASAMSLIRTFVGLAHLPSVVSTKMNSIFLMVVSVVLAVVVVAVVVVVWLTL